MPKAVTSPQHIKSDLEWSLAGKGDQEVAGIHPAHLPSSNGPQVPHSLKHRDWVWVMTKFIHVGGGVFYLPSGHFVMCKLYLKIIQF